MKLNVNGQNYELTIPEDTPLLWALREECKLTGTKFGCGKGLCGACTIHLNGAAIRSCITPVIAAQDASITTIEGLGTDAVSRAVQDAWLEKDVVQCGYCQPGQIMSAAALLAQNPKPDDAAISASMTGNICRCGTYPRIHAAIAKASETLSQGAR